MRALCAARCARAAECALRATHRLDSHCFTRAVYSASSALIRSELEPPGAGGGREGAGSDFPPPTDACDKPACAAAASCWAAEEPALPAAAARGATGCLATPRCLQTAPPVHAADTRAYSACVCCRAASLLLAATQDDALSASDEAGDQELNIAAPPRCFFSAPTLRGGEWTGPAEGSALSPDIWMFQIGRTFELRVHRVEYAKIERRCCVGATAPRSRALCSLSAAPAAACGSPSGSGVCAARSPRGNCPGASVSATLRWECRTPPWCAKTRRANPVMRRRRRREAASAGRTRLLLLRRRRRRCLATELCGCEMGPPPMQAPARAAWR